MDGVLRYVYQPVGDLDAAAELYAGALGLREAWREGDTTRAYASPAGGVEVMVAVTDEPAGPMFEVPDLALWTERAQDVEIVVEPYPIPGGRVAGFRTRDGNVLYVFDRSARAAAAPAIERDGR